MGRSLLHASESALRIGPGRSARNHEVETIRAKAAQLFEIPYRPLERETDLHSGREPYWVTHDVGGLLDPISKGALGRLLPPSLRSKRVRRALLKRIDTLARRNVENVRWALRQNRTSTTPSGASAANWMRSSPA